jgi:Flp pilus assembly protein TadD
VTVLERHFIGATFDDIYTTIFGVERMDATFKHLGTRIGKKSEIEKKIGQLQQQKSLNSDEEATLQELRDELYYLRAYEEQQKIQDRRGEIESRNQSLTRQNWELEGKVNELESQLQSASAIAKSITEEPTNVTRQFFEDLLAREPRNAAVVASHIASLIEDGRPAVANAAIDALKKISSEDVDVLKQLAVVYENLERFSEARSVLERAVQLRPDEAALKTTLERLNKLS